MNGMSEESDSLLRGRPNQNAPSSHYADRRSRLKDIASSNFEDQQNRKIDEMKNEWWVVCASPHSAMGSSHIVIVVHVGTSLAQCSWGTKGFV